MKYVLGIDLGTSATKTVLFDEKGNAVASASREYPLYQPKNGWAEQNPEDWWQGVVKGLKVIAMTGSRESKLSAVADVTIQVPSTETFKIQEYHLPVYHALCAMLEQELF